MNKAARCRELIRKMKDVSPKDSGRSKDVLNLWERDERSSTGLGISLTDPMDIHLRATKWRMHAQ